MKIAVCVKAVPDAATGRKLDPSTGRIDRSGDLALSDFDLHPVEEALRVRDAAGDGEVVVVSLGPAGAADAMRKTLAMGADRSVLVTIPGSRGATCSRLRMHSRERFVGRIRSRPVRPAVRRRGRGMPLGGGRGASRRAGDLTGRGAVRAGRLGDGPAPDRARLRADPRAASRRRRRVGRDQRASLPVAQGDHGRQVEAAGGPRRRGRRRRDRRANDGARAVGAAVAGRAAPHRSCGGPGGDPRVPGREEAPLKTLVFCEHHADGVTKPSLAAISKAASLGGEVAGVIAGSGVGSLAERCGAFGAGTVFVADDSRLGAPLPQPRVDVLAALVRDEGFDTVLFAQSVLAADVAAGLAVRLGAGLNWDLVDLVESGELVGKRPALADSVWVDAGWTSAPRIAVFRSGAFDPVETGGVAEVRPVEVSLEPHSAARRAGGAGGRRAERPVDRGRRRGRGRRARPRRAGRLPRRGGACRGARRRSRGDPRRGRLRLVPVLDAGRPDREDGRAEAVRRGGDLGRDPAQGRDAGLRDDRGDQQGSATRRSSTTPISAWSAT